MSESSIFMHPDNLVEAFLVILSYAGRILNCWLERLSRVL